MRPIVFNGKFYGAGLNGVHRVADRMIREVDALLAATDPASRPAASLILPTRRDWTPELTTIRLEEDPKATSQVWEQFTLPRRAKGAVLVNLCNLAPVLHRSKLLMLHDVQFLFSDSSYPARQRWGYRLITPWMARTSREVLTVSEFSRQMLDLCRVSPRERTVVIHNGVDHLREEAAQAGVIERLGLSNRPFAVHIGSPKAYKNTGVLAKAFSDDRLGDVVPVIVGTTEAALAKVGIAMPPRTVFAGRVSDGELRSLYEHALCVLMPSRTEGFGLPPLEAMSVGCPAVIAPAGAMPEVCRDAVLYADVDAVSDWIAAVRRLRDEPGLREERIRRGRERAGAFLWSAAGARLFERILLAARDDVPSGRP
ncbi:glycosyltransferase family 4 protein [Antarcticirhabdus aurantiaca]|uniref:Glycosyltransferase family 1 protein n=1 Tax=Antarcticirhabdus aurantiaca TaxID=2606717 RepID=A0ACD4NQF7_9HYPH|nr:glycosyltransferase family 1 protein [Antarcticirhabdus aurantiaca]WAJ29170.1 glycosyltransferase family 1 protein [Jeongeuplla avenae]